MSAGGDPETSTGLDRARASCPCRSAAQFSGTAWREAPAGRPQRCLKTAQWPTLKVMMGNKTSSVNYANADELTVKI
jgi:hypothetical protein